jgi:hypothetical protein
VKVLLAKEAAILPRASVRGLPRRGFLLYATSSRTTRKRRVAVVFRSQVHCGIVFRNAILCRSLQPPAPTKCTDRISCLAQWSASAVLFVASAHCFCPSIRILFHALALSSPLNQYRLLCLHIGHCPLEESCLSHSTMQCYSHQRRPRHRTCSLLTIWKLCPHFPETGVCVSFEESR